jgi:hypothetical protein
LADHLRVLELFVNLLDHGGVLFRVLKYLLLAVVLQLLNVIFIAADDLLVVLDLFDHDADLPLSHSPLSLRQQSLQFLYSHLLPLQLTLELRYFLVLPLDLFFESVCFFLGLFSFVAVDLYLSVHLVI